MISFLSLIDNDSYWIYFQFLLFLFIFCREKFASPPLRSRLSFPSRTYLQFSTLHLTLLSTSGEVLNFVAYWWTNYESLQIVWCFNESMVLTLALELKKGNVWIYLTVSSHDNLFIIMYHNNILISISQFLQDYK